MNSFGAALYIVSLYGAYLAGFLYLGKKKATIIFPRVTILITILIAIPTTLQFFFPSMLPILERDTSQFLAGDWWRIITPLFVQDGGVGGSIFNLVSLLLVGTGAEQLWSTRRWLIFFFAGGILSEFVALAWQPIGAGNSIANFSLSASIAVLCLSLDTSKAVKAMAIVALVAGAVLLLFKDIHGSAVVFGAVIALLFIWLDRSMLMKKS